MNDHSIPEGNESSRKNDTSQAGAGSSPGQPPPESASGPQPTSKKAKPAIASESECLAALSKLPGLLVLGLLKPQVANAMRGPYKDLLEHHRHAQQAPANGGIQDDDLLRIVRDHPEFLEMLSGIVTDEQIQLVLKQATDEP
jgi:hypothetical protein